MRPLNLAVRFLLLLILACSGPTDLSITVELNREDSGKTVEVRLGQDIEVMLQTVGPGRYGTPSVSSQALRLVDVVDGNPVPAGPTQIFQFATEGTGSVAVMIPHSADNPSFIVSIVVR